VVAGYLRRLKDQRRIAAWHVMHELNIWLERGKQIKHPGQLLGEDMPEQVTPDAKQLQRMWMSDPTMR
jgi:hypothetical protein